MLVKSNAVATTTTTAACEFYTWLNGKGNETKHTSKVKWFSTEHNEIAANNWSTLKSFSVNDCACYCGIYQLNRTYKSQANRTERSERQVQKSVSFIQLGFVTESDSLESHLSLQPCLFNTEFCTATAMTDKVPSIEIESAPRAINKK